MTKAPQKAFEAASRLPDREQEELAAAILEELAADERREVAFAESQSCSGAWPARRSEEHRADKPRPSMPMRFDFQDLKDASWP